MDILLLDSSQYRTVPYRTVRYSILPLLYRTVRTYGTVPQYLTVLYRTVRPYGTVPYRTVALLKRHITGIVR